MVKDLPTAAISTEAAYEWCERYGKDHYENFSVVSMLVPRNLRKHFYAVYAFCRFTDDLGDEAEGDRIDHLDAFEVEMMRAWGSGARHPIAVAIGATAQEFPLDPEDFRKLIEANRIDQHKTSFATYDELLDYCEHSANPVGHMVLALYGIDDVRRKKLAGATCTALQLTNFWQDIARDLMKGRVYIPAEDMERFRYSRRDLERGVVDRRYRALMAFEAERTRVLYREGLKLLPLLPDVARHQVELFSEGGMFVLEKIERAGFDVFRRRPELSKAAKLAFVARGLLKVRLSLAMPALSPGGSR